MIMAIVLNIEIDREEDGRWIAEITELPGVMAYGTSGKDAMMKVQALALRVLADRIENDEAEAQFDSISFVAA